MTSEPLPAEDRAQAPDAELVRDDGLPVALSSLWAERPLVLVFFGELANPFTGDQAANLRDADEAFARADADIAAIVPAAPEQSLAYRHHWMLPYPLFTDAQGRAHEAFGGAPGASATFVIDRDGAIRLARHAANLADYPPTSTLLTAVCDITGAEPPEQSAPLSYAQDEPASQRIDGKLVSFQRFTCGKCGYGDCERSEQGAPERGPRESMHGGLLRTAGCQSEHLASPRRRMR